MLPTNKSLERFPKQYAYSLFILVIFFLILLASPRGRVSLSLPDQGYQHPWNGSDIMSYVEPAENFLETGTFSRQGRPDLHRTVGYPAFLAGMMFLFGEHWQGAAYIFQLFIFALLFPCNMLLVKELYPEGSGRVTWIITLLLCLGIGTAYTGILLSDQMFASLFYAGLACGVLAIKRKSWSFTLLHVLFIGCAAQVRPTLGLFFIADFFLLVHLGYCDEQKLSSKVKRIIAFSVIAVAILGSAPSFRNLIHHGVFTPTSILSDNLARYLAGPVLIAKGKGKEYQEELKSFKEAQGVEKIAIQKDFASTVIRQYPFETAKRMVYHAVWNSFEPHWQYVLRVFNNGFYLNKILTSDGKITPKIYKGAPFWMMYGAFYILFLLALVRCLKKKEWLFLCALTGLLLAFCASLIIGQGARMRLFAEPLIVDFAVIEFMRILAAHKQQTDVNLIG